jgi:hypothetical protein
MAAAQDELNYSTKLPLVRAYGTIRTMPLP